MFINGLCMEMSFSIQVILIYFIIVKDMIDSMVDCIMYGSVGARVNIGGDRR